MTLSDSVTDFRLRVILRARELGNVSEACRQFGISRTLYYRWRRRFLQYGVDGLRPRPHRPQRWPRQARPELEHAVVAYALLWPTHGPARIAAQLARPQFGGWKVSPSGVYAILRRRGLRTRWERLCRLEDGAAIHTGLLTERTRRRFEKRHVEAERPGDLVCLDTFYIGKLKGVGKVWQLTACDAACSYAIATLTRELSSRQAARFLREHVLRAYRRAGYTVRAVLTDRGAEFSGEFDSACQRLEIEHRRTKPRHAWTNGFVERLQGTILSELWRCAFRRTYYTSLSQLERDLQAYLRFYNRERPHQGYRLKGKTPASVFFARKRNGRNL
jgi:transposase InsO family protein